MFEVSWVYVSGGGLWDLGILFCIMGLHGNSKLPGHESGAFLLCLRLRVLGRGLNWGTLCLEGFRV